MFLRSDDFSGVGGGSCLSCVDLQILGFLVFGLLIGAVGRLLAAAGAPSSWSMSMLCGLAGSAMGALLGHVAGLYRGGDPVAFEMSLIGAFVLVGAYHAALARQRRRA